MLIKKNLTLFLIWLFGLIQFVSVCFATDPNPWSQASRPDICLNLTGIYSSRSAKTDHSFFPLSNIHFFLTSPIPHSKVHFYLFYIYMSNWDWECRLHVPLECVEPIWSIHSCAWSMDMIHCLAITNFFGYWKLLDFEFVYELCVCVTCIFIYIFMSYFRFWVWVPASFGVSRIYENESYEIGMNEWFEPKKRKESEFNAIPFSIIVHWRLFLRLLLTSICI